MFGEFVMTVPDAVPGSTLTTKGKLTGVLRARVWPEFRVQVMVPVPPTAIAGVQVQFVGATKAEAKVVLAGMASVKVTVVVVPEAVMAVGPLLTMDWV